MLTHLLNNASRTKLSSSRTQYSSNTSTKSFVSSKKPLHKNSLVVQKICLAIKKNIVFLLSLDGRVFFSTVFTRFSLEESKDETSARLGLSSAMFSRDDQGRIFRSAMQNSFVSWLARANWGPPPDRIPLPYKAWRDSQNTSGEVSILVQFLTEKKFYTLPFLDIYDIPLMLGALNSNN